MKSLSVHNMSASSSDIASEKDAPSTAYKSAYAPPASVRRGPWSPDEDRRLMSIIAVQGPTNWVRISSSLGSRSPKQCRERYHQNLKPSLNRNPITAEEGQLIEQLVAKHGKKWAEIARHLTGRSDNAIKNWWNGGANRRRRVSHVSIPSNESSGAPSALNSGYNSGMATATNSAPVSNSGSFSHPSMTQFPHLRPLPPSVSPQQSRHNSLSDGHNHGHPHVSQYPKVPQFAQISFNTSMFNESEKRSHAALNGMANGLNGMSASDLPHLSSAKVPIRSASIDHPTLPPLLSNFNRRLGEEDHRRHSVNAALPPTTSPASYSQHLHHHASQPHLTNSNINNSPTQAHNANTTSHSHGEGSSHYSSPVSFMSRQNSLTQDYKHSFALPSAASSSHPSRRSSVAPDFFHNPMAGHGAGEMWLKRNQSSISLHSPSIMPINSNPNRLSVSSASGLSDSGKPLAACNYNSHAGGVTQSAGSMTDGASQGSVPASAATAVSGTASGIPSYKNLLRSINSTPIPEDRAQDSENGQAQAEAIEVDGSQNSDASHDQNQESNKLKVSNLIE